MKHPLLFQWDVSTRSGWGVYGLNLLWWWEALAGTPAYCGLNIDLESLGMADPLRLIALGPLIGKSINARAEIRRADDASTLFQGAVLHGMGNQFLGPEALGGPVIRGLENFAVTFFEDTHFPDPQEVRAKYGLFITGSSWNEQVLKAQGVGNVVKVFQGVDTSLFHPGPSSGALAGRFVIFSGGKLEYRKGQDLVLSAFRIFSQRHPEALLVTAWNSPWPALAATINENPRIAPITFRDDGKVNIPQWVKDNGVADGQFIDLGHISNYLMPTVLREADVALFPNRCEGGTNLVAMECLACGVPIIASDNTGHKDLVATGAPYALTSQGPVSRGDTGTEGWGESNVDEIVACLEKVWTDRGGAQRRGAAGAEVMARWSWKNQIKQLGEAITPYCR